MDVPDRSLPDRTRRTDKPRKADPNKGKLVPVSPRVAGLQTETIGSLVRYAHRALVRVLAEDLAPWDISTAQWSALRVLWEEDGYSQVELARRLRVEKAALTGVLDALERKRLIERVRYEDDRRKFNVFLTPSGRALSGQLTPLATQVTAKAVIGLSKADCTLLKLALSRIIENCEKHGSQSGDSDN